MNIIFTPQPILELTIDGGTLTRLGFKLGTPLQITLRPDGLWITIVTDTPTWNALCNKAAWSRFERYLQRLRKGRGS
ncbi:TPA: hypothetical protein ACHW2M_004009 [Yersinia enterocolitica]|nr:hypothetical protein [Yersinia enterocolitica]EKN5142785.1 hypothetical protein [Yersinia enterocolitica]EKN6225356.1 hypothetical protein [Yersinia enterocolitica]ELI7903241.1 hypothetical protein [Yersinia enterocolitica]ELX2218257.1 hypothetical protein [Yersinia enterocolitica]